MAESLSVLRNERSDGLAAASAFVAEQRTPMSPNPGPSNESSKIGRAPLTRSSGCTIWSPRALNSTGKSSSRSRRGGAIQSARQYVQLPTVPARIPDILKAPRIPSRKRRRVENDDDTAIETVYETTETHQTWRRRSSSKTRSSCGLARREPTSHSWKPRARASRAPLTSPWPPNGGNMCAASPTRTQLSSTHVRAERAW
eukprot:Amastigsp_a3480_70.p2 type:complete len:200 gc:universal Amastigsp_a3480_70:1582-983(-)